MTTAPLRIVAQEMEALGLAYGFGVYSGDSSGRLVYPYFVGEYTETESVTEDGLQEATILLTGFHRGSWLALEEAREKIMRCFDSVAGKTVTMEDGSVVILFYASALIVPKEDMELKSIQINLTVKEWSVT